MYEYIHINSRPRVCSNIIDIQKDLDSGRRESRHNITKEGVGISRQVGGGGVDDTACMRQLLRGESIAVLP